MTMKIGQVITGPAVFCAFVLLVPAAHAQQSVDITYCFSLATTAVSDSDEMRITSFDFKGIARSNTDNTLLDNLTFHGVGVGRIESGKTHNFGYIKFMDADGDWMVTENLRTLEDQEAGNWRFLHGTGKWKGIEGGGKLLRLTRGRPIMPNTSQGCIRMTGTYRLPK